MSRRLLTLVALALAGLLTAGCADDVSPAVRVGDTKIGTADFQAELDEWVGNPALVDPQLNQAGAPGAYSGSLVRGVLGQRIDLMLNDQEFEAQGLELDDSMRQQAIAVVFGDQATADQQLKGFSADYASSILDDLARQIALSTALGEEAYTAWRTDAYATTDIEVSPRYGTWDGSTGAVLAPAAPLPGPAGT